MRKYDILITAQISLGGEFEAETMAEAIDMARLELKSSGEIENVVVERAVYLDEEPLPENVIQLPLDLL